MQKQSKKERMIDAVIGSAIMTMFMVFLFLVANSVYG